MIYYIIAFLIAIISLIYGFVILFSHKPRLPEPSESLYLTNDESRDQLYDLPPRITPDSVFKYQGIDISLIIQVLMKPKE